MQNMQVSSYISVARPVYRSLFIYTHVGLFSFTHTQVSLWNLQVSLQFMQVSMTASLLTSFHLHLHSHTLIGLSFQRNTLLRTHTGQDLGLRLRVKGLGVEVQGINWSLLTFWTDWRSRVQGFGFRVQGLGVRGVRGLGIMGQGLGCRVQGLGFRLVSFDTFGGLQVQGVRFRVQCLGVEGLWGLGFRT